MKSGNAVILRGGSDSYRSCLAIHDCLVEGLREADLPEASITLVPTRDRAAVGLLLSGLNGGVDVIVPRGGKSLVARVEAEARVPVFAHLEGVNHVYVDHAANLGMAKSIVTEDEAVARKFLHEVDAAIVLHNASTQFADGGEFGFGAEIGIATGKFHARGPVGAEQLTSFKYRVHGTGQTRP